MPGRYGCAKTPVLKGAAGTEGGALLGGGEGEAEGEVVMPRTQAGGAGPRRPPVTSAAVQAAGAIPHGDVSQLPKKERHGRAAAL